MKNKIKNGFSIKYERNERNEKLKGKVKKKKRE